MRACRPLVEWPAGSAYQVTAEDIGRNRFRRKSAFRMSDSTEPKGKQYLGSRFFSSLDDLAETKLRQPQDFIVINLSSIQYLKTGTSDNPNINANQPVRKAINE